MQRRFRDVMRWANWQADHTGQSPCSPAPRFGLRNRAVAILTLPNSSLVICAWYLLRRFLLRTVSSLDDVHIIKVIIKYILFNIACYLFTFHYYNLIIIYAHKFRQIHVFVNTKCQYLLEYIVVAFVLIVFSINRR